MKQKHDELKAAIERGIVDNSKAVGKNDDSGHVLFEGCMSIFCLEEIICVADITGLVPAPPPPSPSGPENKANMYQVSLAVCIPAVLTTLPLRCLNHSSSSTV